MNWEALHRKPTRSPERTSESESPLKARAVFFALVASLHMVETTPATSGEEPRDPTSIIRTEIDIHTNTTIQLKNGEALVIPPLGDYAETGFIYKPEHSDPARIIIFIPQKHIVDAVQMRESGLDTSKLQEELNATALNQKYQYRILKELVSTKAISTVCSEGLVTDASIESIETSLREALPLRIGESIAPYMPESSFTSEFKKYRDQMTAQPGDVVKQNTIHSFGTDFQAQIDEYKYAIGGDLILASENQITLCPAETRETYDMLWSNEIQNLLNTPGQYLNAMDTARIITVVDTNRQDAAIQQVVKQNQPVVALTYGRGHDFSAALARWNAAHPELPLGMLTINPLNDMSRGFTQ